MSSKRFADAYHRNGEASETAYRPNLSLCGIAWKMQIQSGHRSTWIGTEEEEEALRFRETARISRLVADDRRL